MRTSDKYDHLLKSKGISLLPLGASDIALKRDDALQAVEFLRPDEIPILGGDVWLRHGVRIEPAYANWHNEPKQEDDRLTYLRRSWETTEKYIKAFPRDVNSEPLFSLVTGEVL